MSDKLKQYLTIHVGHTRVKIGVFEFTEDDSLPAYRFATSVENGNDFPWPDVEQYVTACLEISEPNALASGDSTRHADQATPAASAVGSKGNRYPIPNQVLTETAPLVSILTGSNQTKMNEILNQWDDRFPPPISVRRNSEIPVKSLVEVPEKVGADRLLNAVAVNVMREPSRPAIIVDSGTAVTVDVVDQSGNFLGGAILPGTLMGAKALHEFTTTLPLIDGREFLKQTPSAIGTNTESAMASGLYWGHLGAITELIEQITQELDGEPQIFVTGGALPILSPYFPDAVCEPYMTLMGTVLTVAHLK